MSSVHACVCVCAHMLKSADWMYVCTVCTHVAIWLSTLISYNHFPKSIHNGVEQVEMAFNMFLTKRKHTIVWMGKWWEEPSSWEWRMKESGRGCGCGCGCLLGQQAHMLNAVADPEILLGGWGYHFINSCRSWHFQ